MFDWTNTYLELESSDVDTAVLLIGAIEQHGPHLPISVDWFTGEALARGVAEGLNAFQLPGIPFGNSHAHHGFRGSVSVSPETLDGIVRDISLNLMGQGFRRIAVLNFHGGNLIVKPTTRDINLTQNTGKVVQLHPSFVAAERLSRIFESDLADEQHAGELETSLMLHLAPEQVGPQRIDHVPNLGPAEFDYRPMRDFCPDGVWDRSSLASAEKGKQALAAMIEDTVVAFEETFSRLGVPTRQRSS
jgi:creatinine amidohydrolase